MTQNKSRAQNNLSDGKQQIGENQRQQERVNCTRIPWPYQCAFSSLRNIKIVQLGF